MSHGQMVMSLHSQSQEIAYLEESRTSIPVYLMASDGDDYYAIHILNTCTISSVFFTSTRHFISMIILTVSTIQHRVQCLSVGDLNHDVFFLLPGLLLGQVQPQFGGNVMRLDIIGCQNQQERQLQMFWNVAHVSK